MKTAAVAVALSAAVVSANPQRQHGLPEGTEINCSKPNANFCMGEDTDIILRCDENGVGTRGRCSDNVAGYPPAGGTATCWQSDRLAGDAACVKNCVVYAEESFTLPADKCDPSVIPTGLQETPTQDAGTTGIVTIPEGTGPWSSAPTQDAGTTGIATVPEGTGPWSSAPTPGTTYTDPINSCDSSVIIDPIPSEWMTSSMHSEQPTPTGDEQTTSPPVATGAAPTNQAIGGLAMAGIVAAYLV